MLTPINNFKNNTNISIQKKVIKKNPISFKQQYFSNIPIENHMERNQLLFLIKYPYWNYIQDTGYVMDDYNNSSLKKRLNTFADDSDIHLTPLKNPIMAEAKTIKQKAETLYRHAPFRKIAFDESENVPLQIFAKLKPEFQKKVSDGEFNFFVCFATCNQNKQEYFKALESFFDFLNSLTSEEFDSIGKSALWYISNEKSKGTDISLFELELKEALKKHSTEDIAAVLNNSTFDKDLITNLMYIDAKIPPHFKADQNNVKSRINQTNANTPAGSKAMEYLSGLKQEFLDKFTDEEVNELFLKWVNTINENKDLLNRDEKKTPYDPLLNMIYAVNSLSPEIFDAIGKDILYKILSFEDTKTPDTINLAALKVFLTAKRLSVDEIKFYRNSQTKWGDIIYNSITNNLIIEDVDLFSKLATETFFNN